MPRLLLNPPDEKTEVSLSISLTLAEYHRLYLAANAVDKTSWDFAKEMVMAALQDDVTDPKGDPSPEDESWAFNTFPEDDDDEDDGQETEPA